MIIEKGKWVQIRRQVLTPEGRAPQVPEDTKKTPLTMWVKGYLDADAKIGQKCSIITLTGRTEHGILEEAEPAYSHDFGAFVPEFDAIRRQVKGILEEGK